MDRIFLLFNKMVEYYSNDPKRIQHFIKVHSFAGLIGRHEGLSGRELEILEVAALVHDIGIKPAEKKYGSCTGKLQEKEGPAEAEKMLVSLNFPQDIIERVSYLVAHHHTYDTIDKIDYQILVEADFLVNIYEDNLDRASVWSVYEKIFRTSEGKMLCHTMFGLEDDV